MKRKSFKRIGLMLIVLLFFSLLQAEENANNRIQKTEIIPRLAYFDINHITCSVQNNAVFARHPVTGNSDFLYKGVYYIYASGVWMGAKVNGEVRASAADYNTDFVGGAIDATGIPFGKNDSTFRVYKISTGDNATNNIDYAQWPGWLGAPVNEYGNPLLLGDQTLWTSFTDAFAEERINYNICPPLGAEVHLTVWGWEELDDMMFLRWEFINKSPDTWEDAYLGVWSDPDVFDANDDLTGSDSTLNLVYCFDKERWNGTVKNCIGYGLLETPVIPSPGDTAIVFGGDLPGYRNAPVYSPLYLKHDMEGWVGPPYATYETAQMVYDRLKTLNMYGEQLIDPLTGAPSRWAYSGDPILETGWLDPLARDRMMLISTGPITVLPGDTCAMTLAILPVQQVSSKTAISDLKKQIPAVHSLFKNDIGIYTNTVATIKGAQHVALPVVCLNTQNFNKIDFHVSSNSSNINFTDILPVERTSDFVIRKNVDTLNNLIEVVFEKLNEGLIPGNEPIANLFVNVADTVDSVFSDFLITNITCLGADGISRSLKPVKGTIFISEFSNVPRLIEPLKKSYIDGMTINFRWTAISENDSNTYLLDFFKMNKKNKVTSDTSIVLNIRDFVLESKYDKNVDWSVKILNNLYPAASPDTFQFTLPAAENIYPGEPFQTFSFEDTDEYYFSIQSFDFYDPCLYLYVSKTNKNNYNVTYWLYVVDLTWQPIVVSLQQLADGREAVIKIFGDRAIICVGNKIKLYNIEENRQIEFKSETIVYSLIENVFIRQNLVFVDARNELLIFQIDDADNLIQSPSYSLTFWPAANDRATYVRYSNTFDLEENFLYLVKGDLGIFDVSRSDSIKLISRTDVPGLATTIDYEADKVYLGNNQNWLGIYDVSTKENPTEIYGEQFAFTGSIYEQITMLKVIRGYIFFENFYIDGVLSCHYEPGENFKLDLASKFGNDHIVNRHYIYSRKWDSITIYMNRLTSDVPDEPFAKAEDFRLLQNYPNPFNPVTTLKFQINEPGQTSLIIYNLLGQQVRQLLNKNLQPGSYTLNWDGKNESMQLLSSGLYFARLSSGQQTKLIKMVLVR